MPRLIIFLLFFISSNGWANGTTCPSINPTLTNTRCYYGGSGFKSSPILVLNALWATDTNRCDPYTGGPADVNCTHTNASGVAYDVAVHCTSTQSCPADYTLSGNQCIATVSTICDAPLNCQTTPTVTTVGQTQTINWEVENQAAHMCDHNSVSCTFPLVANVEMKRCDLDCGNGSIIDPSTGAQCPACIGGQVRNPNTNVCEDPQCDPPKYLNTATHSCADEPNCIGGQTLDTSQVPHACLDPQCVSPQVLNLATRLCETPPDICQPGYTLVNGVCTLDQCQAPKVQCNFGGQQVCLTFCDGPNGTDGDGTDADSSGSGSGSGDGSGSGGGSGSGDGSGSGSGSGSGETATPGTMTNPGGSIGNYTPPSFESLGAGMGTPSAQTSSGASVTSNSTAGTPAMGQFTPAISAPDPNLGKWYTPTTDTYQGVLSDTIAAIQQQPIMQFGQDIFDVQIGGGSCSPLVFPAVMGMDEITSDWICADFMEYFWPIIRAIVIGSAVFMAFRIALSGLS